MCPQGQLWSRKSLATEDHLLVLPLCRPAAGLDSALSMNSKATIVCMGELSFLSLSLKRPQLLLAKTRCISSGIVAQSCDEIVDFIIVH